MTALEFEQGRITEERHQAYFSPPPGGVVQGLVDRVARPSERIPQDVKLAFHLCYGDLWHKHFVEPEDTALFGETCQRHTGPRQYRPAYGMGSLACAEGVN